VLQSLFIVEAIICFGNINTNSAGYINNLTYSYNGNKLRSVEDAGYGTLESDFKNSVTETEEYEYDGNGNMIRDDNKGVSVFYNALNLPVCVVFDAGGKIEWTYTSGGEKVRRTTYNTDETVTVTDYVGGFVYADNDLDYFNFDEGVVKPKSGSYYPDFYAYNYFLKGHLGNTRIVFSDEDNDGVLDSNERLQENHYYPFGMKQYHTTADNDPSNKYLYNGKELEDDLGLYWYHYGARYYDPQLGRWHTVDPVDEFNSPYLYCRNNPVLYFDPDGMDDY